MSPDFAPVPALLGGALLGLAATVLLYANGRVAGISGITGGLFDPRPGDVAWRGAFLAGMLVVGIGAGIYAPELYASTAHRPPAALAVAGLLVGFGTRLGNGCTSGHGVCGLSRLSTRSLASVVTFMGVAGVVVFLTARAFGGA